MSTKNLEASLTKATAYRLEKATIRAIILKGHRPYHALST
jgi:hypothetical protein